MWIIRFPCKESQADFFISALENKFLSCTCYEISENKWAIEALSQSQPDKVDVINDLTLLFEVLAEKLPEISIEELESTNWVEKVYEQFPPQHIGGFYVHGSHVAEDPSKISLTVDAATAFGSGEHETTKGCLLAIDRLRKRFNFHNILDLGCGSGILAMAAYKVWSNAQVLATDIDEEAVRVSQENFVKNNATAIHTFQSDGFNDSALKTKCFDLIIANILANPLKVLAKDIKAHLKPGGMIILSGLLKRQIKDVMNAYELIGFKRYQIRTIGNWAALILKRIP